MGAKLQLKINVCVCVCFFSPRFQVKLTPQEVNLLPKCRSKLERDMKVGAAVGVGFGWAG